jgi:hypothetical protein
MPLAGWDSLSPIGFLNEPEVSPGPEERTHTPAHQVENFMDVAHLKQLMKRVLDHSVPPSFKHRLYGREAAGSPIQGSDGS